MDVAISTYLILTYLGSRISSRYRFVLSYFFFCWIVTKNYPYLIFLKLFDSINIRLLFVKKMHALTQTYNHSVVMPIWLVLTCEVPEKFEKKKYIQCKFQLWSLGHL